jgi:acetate kinase
MLYHQSGLLGISGISSDMRTLEQNSTQQAQEAIDLFCRMAAKEIGGLMTMLGGLDALVFTGGIGEHSPMIRCGICDYLIWAGLILDEVRNQENAGAIHTKDSQVDVYVIPTNEEIVIARACIEFNIATRHS